MSAQPSTRVRSGASTHTAASTVFAWTALNSAPMTPPSASPHHVSRAHTCVFFISLVSHRKFSPKTCVFFVCSGGALLDFCQSLLPEKTQLGWFQLHSYKAGETHSPRFKEKTLDIVAVSPLRGC